MCTLIDNLRPWDPGAWGVDVVPSSDSDTAPPALLPLIVIVGERMLIFCGILDFSSREGMVMLWSAITDICQVSRYACNVRYVAVCMWTGARFCSFSVGVTRTQDDYFSEETVCSAAITCEN